MDKNTGSSLVTRAEAILANPHLPTDPTGRVKCLRAMAQDFIITGDQAEGATAATAYVEAAAALVALAHVLSDNVPAHPGTPEAS